MPVRQHQEGDEEFAALLRAVREWDGSLESAGPIRRQAAGFDVPRRNGTTPEERGLMAALSSYRKKDPARLWFDPDRDPESARSVAPFVGDPRIGAWPWDDPAHMREEDGQRWLPLLGRFGAWNDRGILAACWQFHRTRPRSSWLPASLALAELSIRSDALLAQLLDEWRVCFGDAVPERWPKTGLADAHVGVSRPPDLTHRARHILHTMSAVVGRGGRLDGALDLARIAEMPLPPDGADASVVLNAIGELHRREDLRARIVAALPSRAPETPADLMAEAALRSLYDAVSGSSSARPAIDAIRARLQETRWCQIRSWQRADALWSWLQTAAWARAQGHVDIVADMLRVAGEAERPAALMFDQPGGDPVELALRGLKVLLDPVVFSTTPDSPKAVCVVETVLLLARPEVAALPWAAIVERAVGRVPTRQPAPGLVRDAALSDLVLALADQDYTPAFILRDRVLSPESVVRLAASHNGFVATQVAVQAERLLRQAIIDAQDQIRFIWRVLEQDPPDRTFVELRRMLRGEDTPLHRLTEAATRLDAVRPKHDHAELARAHADFLRAAATVLPPSAHGAGGGPADQMKDLAAAFAAVGRPVVPAKELADSLAGLKSLLIGEHDRGGLGWFLRWLGHSVPELDERWDRFERALGVLRSSASALSRLEYNEFVESAARLRDVTAQMAWPERATVDHVLGRIAAWACDLLRESERGDAQRRRVQHLLAVSDEDGVVGFLDDEGVSMAWLRQDDLKNIHRFLLDHLLLKSAGRLRARARERMALPSAWSHLAPLFQGAVGGPFVVLDIGTPWNELLTAGHTVPFWSTVVASLLLSYGILTGSLASFANVSLSPLRPFMAFSARVFKAWIAAFSVSAVVSVLMMLTLSGTSLRTSEQGAIPLGSQVLLWSSLAMVLGVLLQLVLQGRSAAEHR